MRTSNVLWKSLQSILGFALIGYQSKLHSKEDLAVLAIAQSLIVTVSFFDLGLGVNITNEIVERTKTLDKRGSRLSSIGMNVILDNRQQIISLAGFQSAIFLLIFRILTNQLNHHLDISVLILFTATIFCNSIGNFFGRLYIALGEISLLVKLQGIGASIAFTAGILASITEWNLQLAISSLCLSSIFIGISALFHSKSFFRRIQEKSDFTANSKLLKISSSNLSIQVGQISQIAQPALIQYLVLRIFGVSGLVSYLISQRIFNSIANIFGVDLQLNLSLRDEFDRINYRDVLRFKTQLLGYSLFGLAVTAFTSLFWAKIFPHILRPGQLDLLSFVLVGLGFLSDQSLRYRMYGLSDFVRSAFGELVFFAAVYFSANFPDFNHFFEFNFFLFLVYVFKIFFLFFSIRVNRFNRNS